MIATVVDVILGLWLMISPAVLEMDQSTANNNHIVGPLVITFAVIALWKINRHAIKANILLGAWLFIALFLLHFASTLAFFSNGICSVLIILLSSLKRKPVQNFGGGWRSLFQHNPPHMVEAERQSRHSQS